MGPFHLRTVFKKSGPLAQKMMEKIDFEKNPGK